MPRVQQVELWRSSSSMGLSVVGDYGIGVSALHSKHEVWNQMLLATDCGESDQALAVGRGRLEG